MSNPRIYHVVAINERTRLKYYLTAKPVTHAEGCTLMSKVSKHKHTRCQLEEAEDMGLSPTGAIPWDGTVTT